MFPDRLKSVQDDSGVKQIVMIHEQRYDIPQNYKRLGLEDEMKAAGVKNIFSAMDGDMF